MPTIFQDDAIIFSHSTNPHPEQSKFDLHVHDYYEIFCFVSGHASYLVEGQMYKLPPGCLMLMRPSEAHKLLEPRGVYERYVLHFRPDVLQFPKELLSPFDQRGLGEKNRYRSDELDDPDTLRYFARLERMCMSYPYREVAASGLVSLLGMIGEAYAQKQDHDGMAEDEVGRELLRYVNANLTEELSLESIAAHIHLSSSQTGRIFKRLTGTTVYDYILSKRLILAQKLIERGEGAMSASRQCGFRDYSAFYRLCKKRGVLKK